MAIRISRAALDAIARQAAASPAAEVCGLLLGAAGLAAEDVRTALPAANVAADPARRFELDPAALIAAHRRARAGGEAVLGHYHSHPSGDVRPSARDAAMAFEANALWLICAPDGRWALWRALPDAAEAPGPPGAPRLHGRFVPVATETA